ncbi:MAG: type II secretion system GspH family protein [Gammaproteobacteria bacterium]|jgi:prepilin-type N-terminal cleavage/methylation domain-containing protein|nr:type II secretion system GspH family protein [Gammaproteobacteria bacterium]
MQPLRKAIQKGFTLVELLIVVIILALLAAIVVPQFASSTDDAKLASLDTTLSNVRAAIDLYYQQHGEYPGELTAVDAACVAGTDGTGIGGPGAQGAQAFLDQLSLYSDADGGTCSVKDANFEFGPYLKKNRLPDNPITNVGSALAGLVVVNGGDILMGGDAANLGWKYDILTGKFIANDTTDIDGAGPGTETYDQR